MKTKKVTIHETKTHLSRLLREVAAGTEIIIAKGNSPVAKLVRFDPPHLKRVPGLSKGKIWISPDFEEPLKDFEDYQ
jgi:prevent-host-death family protein